MTYERLILVTLSLLIGGSLLADSGHEATADHAPLDNRLAEADVDPARGRILFVEKGCITCHSVNGVGGEDASALDAHGMEMAMNPFELAAKMWRVAPLMIAAQEEAFGEQILFDGSELADITGFLHDDAEQHKLTEKSLPSHILGMMDHMHGGMTGEAAHAEEIGHD